MKPANSELDHQTAVADDNETNSMHNQDNADDDFAFDFAEFYRGRERNENTSQKSNQFSNYGFDEDEFADDEFDDDDIDDESESDDFDFDFEDDDFDFEFEDDDQEDDSEDEFDNQFADSVFSTQSSAHHQFADVEIDESQKDDAQENTIDEETFGYSRDHELSSLEQAVAEAMANLTPAASQEDAVVESSEADLSAFSDPHDEALAAKFAALQAAVTQGTKPEVVTPLQTQREPVVSKKHGNPLVGTADIKLDLSCEVGHVQLSVAEIGQLGVGSTIEFQRWPSKVILRLNELSFAEGYLVEINGMLGVKITNKISTLK